MRAILKNLVIALFGAVLSLGAVGLNEADAMLKGSGGASSVTAAAYPLLAPDGSKTAPSYSFTNATGNGWFWRSGIATGLAGNSGKEIAQFSTVGNLFLGGSLFGLSSSGVGDMSVAGPDVQLSADAANTLAQKNSTAAQVNRLYFSTTGPIYWQATARTAGVLYTGTGGAAQVSYAQTTVPTVTVNGGTGPVCVGTDTAMACTIGTAPPAAATFTIGFNGTWPAAPSCIAMRGTTGATPLVQGVVSGTTTLVVNLSANLVASERYNIQCFGVS